MILTKTVKYRGKEVGYDDLKRNSVIPLTVKCDECGTYFETTKYRLIRNGHELCQTCALRRKHGKQLPVGFKSGRLTVIKPSEKFGYSICKCSCGNEVEVNNTSLRTERTKSCGCLQKEKAKETAQKVLSQYQHKETHPNWKGGVSPERNCIEKTKEYKQWKLKVLSVGKCEKCGCTADLVPHHICNFQDYPALRLDTANGACLCQKCHRDFHHIYGLNGTTREQFENFIKEKI